MRSLATAGITTPAVAGTGTGSAAVVASLIIYLLGFIVITAGLAMAASMLGVPDAWIIIGIVILVGIMLLSLGSRFRNGP